MSWEEMDRRDYPCSCGKGTYTEVVEMDDWNRRREHRTINCPECAENQKIAKLNEAKERERLKQLDEKKKPIFVNITWRNGYLALILQKTKKKYGH